MTKLFVWRKKKSNSIDIMVNYWLLTFPLTCVAFFFLFLPFTEAVFVPVKHPALRQWGTKQRHGKKRTCSAFIRTIKSTGKFFLEM